MKMLRRIVPVALGLGLALTSFTAPAQAASYQFSWFKFSWPSRYVSPPVKGPSGNPYVPSCTPVPPTVPPSFVPPPTEAPPTFVPPPTEAPPTMPPPTMPPPTVAPPTAPPPTMPPATPKPPKGCTPGVYVGWIRYSYANRCGNFYFQPRRNGNYTLIVYRNGMPFKTYSVYGYANRTSCFPQFDPSVNGKSSNVSFTLYCDNNQLYSGSDVSASNGCSF